MKYDRFIPMVSHNVHSQQYITYTQNLTYVLNQNVNITKLARIVENLCFSGSSISGTQSKYY